jgi:hypothetical protein
VLGRCAPASSCWFYDLTIKHVLTQCFIYNSFIVSTFVPKKGIVSSKPKQIITNNGRANTSTRKDIKMMPIGVPKVAYRVPGGMGAEW